MAVTWSAVALSLDFAAAMSSAEGIFGAAGRWTVRGSRRGRCLGREGEGSGQHDGGTQHGGLQAGSGQTHS